ncbi:DEAD/DEAH box helicase [Candidatus Parcubacteria bacterium]|nr:DEAD/DEAH box helicase [Candidatus Parcubacteria bacterium]
MATTYIVRKNTRNDLRDRPGYRKFADKRGGRGGDRPQGRGGYSRGDSRGGGNSRGRGGRGKQSVFSDISKLVNKAQPQEAEALFVPTHLFGDFPIDTVLKENIASRNYEKPTPIQDEAIPHALAGEDVVGLANTGTGKTAAFLIPLIDKVVKLRALGTEERVLIMVPTRELATQIEQEFWGFAKRLNMNAVVCVGGASIEPQIRVLRRSPSFVIGTPGRLKDLDTRREVDFSKFRNVVLDEADRMLDMGFIDDMRFILGKTPRDRQTLFFSATMGRDIERLVGEFLKNPVRISVKTRDTAATIDQDVVHVARGDKFEKLVEMLSLPAFEKTLVFGRTKHGVERLARDLVRRGVRAESIHGDKTYGRRQKALTLFKKDHVDVLVATDVAARGLDISGVSHVINYDLPASYEDYTHRIGRTGRAGKTGQALTFIER